MALPVLAAIGGAMIVGGAIGTAVSGALSKSDIGWADFSARNNQIAAQQQGQGQYSALANAYMNRAGPELGGAAQYAGAKIGPTNVYGGATIDPTADAASRASQASVAAKLTDQMNGVGPSLADLQMKQGLAASLKAQQASAASMRGGAVNASLAMRNLGDQASAMRQGLVGQAGIARLQEQQAAMGQLAGLSTSMRQQDFGAALQQAQLQQQAGMFNAGQLNQSMLTQAQLQQQAGLANAEALNKFTMGKYQGDLSMMGMNDAATKSMLEMRQHSMDQNLEAEQRGIDQFYAGQKQNWEAEEASKKRKMALWGSIIGAGGNLLSMSDETQKEDVETESGASKQLAGIGKNLAQAYMQHGGDGAAAGAMSDERTKTSVASGGSALRSFYDSMEPHSYKYKDPTLPGAGEGRFVSPMAQELEKSEIGRSMVVDTPNGKMVDYGKGLGAMLAGQADFHDRLTRLEAALSKKKGSK